MKMKKKSKINLLRHCHTQIEDVINELIDEDIEKYMDMKLLSNNLRDAFINYQYNLDYPMRSSEEIKVNANFMYNSHTIFRNKVDSMTESVLGIVEKWLKS